MIVTPHRARSGFTLMELLVVIGIIAVLAALAYPVSQRLLQGSRATACTSNLRQLAVALNGYLGDHNQMMPELRAARADLSEDVPAIDNTLERYIASKQVFACPADSRGIWKKTGTSYYWNVALNGQALASLNFLAMNQDHSRIPVLSDKEAFHPYTDTKVNILYADGHASKDVRFFTQ